MNDMIIHQMVYESTYTQYHTDEQKEKLFRFISEANKGIKDGIEVYHDYREDCTSFPTTHMKFPIKDREAVLKTIDGLIHYDNDYHVLEECDKFALRGIYTTEKALTSEERKNLSNKAFGIPELRKYPLIDEEHVMSAIRYFAKADEKYRKELARNIKKAMKKFKISEDRIGEENLIRKYL